MPAVSRVAFPASQLPCLLPFLPPHLHLGLCTPQKGLLEVNHPALPGPLQQRCSCSCLRRELSLLFKLVPSAIGQPSSEIKM